MNKSHEYIINTIESMLDETLKIMCLNLMKEDDWLFYCPASKRYHQSYKGGLLVHMTEVLESALKMADSSFLEVDKDALITAIIYHDIGKLDEYTIIYSTECKDQKGYDIECTSQKRLIGHLSKSYAIFYKDAIDNKLNSSLIEKIGHIILAHHGRFEYGSPVEPELTEAYIIHFADMLSTKVSKTKDKEGNN